MTYVQAIVLGVIQGLAEFLPISSDGHLSAAQHVMGLDAESVPMILFDVIAHCGTLISITIVFWVTFTRFFRRLLVELAPSKDKRPWLVRNAAWRTLLLGVLASIPTGLIGVLFKHQLEAAYGMPVIIGLGFWITGAFLYVAETWGRPHKPLRQFGPVAALAIGIGQGLAIAPGVSRSALTISTSLMFGLKRRWAAEFSFFIAFPAICGATVIKLKDAFKMPHDQLSGLVGPIAVGAVISAIVGYFALRLLLVAVRAAKLRYFSYYVWIIGAVVIVMALTGHMKPNHTETSPGSSTHACVSPAGPMESASDVTRTSLPSETHTADRDLTAQHTRRPSSNGPLVHSNSARPAAKPTLATGTL